MNITYSFDSAISSKEIFKKMRNYGTYTASDIHNYYNTAGIQFLKRHLFHYGGTILNEDTLDNLFNNVISNPKENKNDNIFISIRRPTYKRTKKYGYFVH